MINDIPTEQFVWGIPLLTFCSLFMLYYIFEVERKYKQSSSDQDKYYYFEIGMIFSAIFGSMVLFLLLSCLELITRF